MVSKKLLIFILLGVSFIFATITLGLSFSQIKDQYHGITIQGSKDCNDIPNPFKQAEKGNHDSYVQCNWSRSRSAVRILYSLFLIVVGSLFIFSIIKGSKMFLLLALLLLLNGGVGIFSFIYDIKSLNSGKDYCKESYIDFGTHHESGDCLNQRFNATVTFNLFTSIAIIATAIVSGIFRKSINTDQH